MNDSIEIVDRYDSDSDQENDQRQNQLNIKLDKGILNRNNMNGGQGYEEIDQEQLQHLQMYVDPEMENVQIDIQDSKIQYDWLIFEQHTYTINTKLSSARNNYRNVTRRFSDFEWLFQELLFTYPGYILPALPEKGLYSKLDPKIPFLNKIKNEFMDARKEMLRLFLIELLKHKELKYARELKFFLISPDNQFAEEKERIIGNKGEREQENFGLVKNIYNYGLGVFNIAINQQATEKRKQTEIDEQFEAYQIYYQKQHNKLKELNDCFCKIFESRKKQAENFKDVSEIFRDIKESQNLNNDLNHITWKIGINQAAQTNHLIKVIQIPLKQYTEQLKNCIESLEFRKKQADRIHLQDIEIKQLKQDSERQNEAINMNLRLNEEKKKHQKFIQNFIYNEDYFKDNINQRIKELISEFNCNEKYGANKLLQIWSEKN